MTYGLHLIDAFDGSVLAGASLWCYALFVLAWESRFLLLLMNHSLYKLT